MALHKKTCPRCPHHLFRKFNSSKGNISVSNKARDYTGVGGGVGRPLTLEGAKVDIDNSTRDAARVWGGAVRPSVMGGADLAIIVGDSIRNAAPSHPFTQSCPLIKLTKQHFHLSHQCPTTPVLTLCLPHHGFPYILHPMEVVPTSLLAQQHHLGLSSML